MFSFFHLSSILLRIFLKRAKNRYFCDVFFSQRFFLMPLAFYKKKIQISIFLISIEQFLENRETGLDRFFSKIGWFTAGFVIPSATLVQHSKHED
jgi:hypothetical protein